jgi:hypothetical protein
MKKFDLQHWWNLIAAAGAITVVAFFIAQLTHGFLLGIGLLLFGVGERINHREPRGIVSTEIPGSSITTESYPRDPNLAGLALDVIGIVFFGIGFLLMVLAP